MVTKKFEDVLAACYACIVSCEHCIMAADLCTKEEAGEKNCQDFLARRDTCIETAIIAVKACNELIAEFGKAINPELLNALNLCIKVLGDHNRTLEGAIKNYNEDHDCAKACAESKAACGDAISALKECIESCKKHQ